jgi:hypothetical protein
MERVPPRAYGGTERVIAELVRELDRRGQEVTTFATADSDVPGRLIPTVSEPLRVSTSYGDSSNYVQLTVESVLDHASEFDIIHSHLEWMSVLLARVSPTPVVSTFHGRLDMPFADEMFSRHTPGLVAISENQPPRTRRSTGRRSSTTAHPRRRAASADAARPCASSVGSRRKVDRRRDRDRC